MCACLSGDMTSPRTPRRFAVATSVGLAVLGVVGLAACDSGPEGSPSQVAEAVADALEAGDLSGLPVVDGTPETSQQQLEQAYAGLGEAPLSVEVVEVEPADDAMRSTARLRLTFDLPGEGSDLVREVPMRMRVSEDVWSVAWEHALLGVPLGQRLEVEQVREPRADIVDRDGDPLATRRPVWRIGIDKTRLAGEQATTASRDLAEAAGLDEDAYSDRVTSAGPEAFVELITYRQDDPDGQELAAATDDIPGATAIEDEQVLGPTRTFAQPLLGTVGPVTAELLEAEPERYEAGDVVGLTGLQAAFDDQLRGQPSTRVVAVDEDTGSSTPVMEQEAEAGEELRLTLSGPLQREAEAALAEVGPPSAIVALDHSTGDLLAVANGPGSQGASTALAGQYAPGSTFKVASALGLLRQGFTPGSEVTCAETLTVDGYRFTNVPGYPTSALGPISLTTALANSCNTALIDQRDEVPMTALAGAAADLGLGAVWDMPVTAFSGSVPDAAQSDTEHAASLIGQGRVLVSPTAMAAFAGTVAQGEPVVPRIVAQQQVPSPTGGIQPSEARALQEMMRAVVTEGGASILADNPGPPIIAKTGTAEFGTQDPLQTHVWMIAVQGDLAVAVFVEEGELGSTTAGPIMDAFLTEAHGLLP